MSAQSTERRSVWSGLVLVVVGVWLIVAPQVFGRDEAADWAWSPLVALGLSGSAAVVAGAAMLAPSRRWARYGGLLAVGVGLAMIVAAATTIMWVARTVPVGDLRLDVWLGFFAQAGMLIAALGAYGLGWLDPGTEPARRMRPALHSPCESRRRRFNVGPLAAAREGRHGAARRRGRSGGSARS